MFRRTLQNGIEPTYFNINLSSCTSNTMEELLIGWFGISKASSCSYLVKRFIFSNFTQTVSFWVVVMGNITMCVWNCLVLICFVKLQPTLYRTMNYFCGPDPWWVSTSRFRITTVRSHWLNTLVFNDCGIGKSSRYISTHITKK